MNTRNITVTSQSLEDTLLPLLINNVFHVTNGEAFKKIQDCEFVGSNKNNVYRSVFSQSNKNFGAQNNMVCLLDLRQKTLAEAKTHAGDGYYFLRPKIDWTEIIFLLIDKSFYKDLKMQARFDPPCVGSNYVPMDEITKGLYVPEIECWYPEKITLNKISSVLRVSIVENQS